MGKIKVLAGDFTGDGTYADGRITLRPKEKPSPAHRMKVREFFESVEVAAQHNAVKVGGALGWGAAGALLGGRGRDVVFVGTLKDGRKLLARTDAATYTALRADLM